MDGYVDVENELEDTVEEGESGMNGESSINIYIYGGEGGSRGREYMYNHE